MHDWPLCLRSGFHGPAREQAMSCLAVLSNMLSNTPQSLTVLHETDQRVSDPLPSDLERRLQLTQAWQLFYDLHIVPGIASRGSVSRQLGAEP